MKAGKIPGETLRNLLSNLTIISDSGVELGPAIGEDTAVINIKGQTVLIGSDPITFPTENPGWHSVIINSNDVAASGGVPKWYSATILMPEHSTEQEFSSIFKDIAETCSHMNIQLIGGHSEVTPAVQYPVVSGSMIGIADNLHVKPTHNAKEFDDILITKHCPIEGIKLLLSYFPNLSQFEGLSPSDIEFLKRLSIANNMDILPEATLLKTYKEVNSMHDPTEGGIATGLAEVTSASNVGALIYESELPIPAAFRKICSQIEIDPLGLIASGSLLFTTSAGISGEIIGELKSLSIQCSNIGQIMPREHGSMLIESYSNQKVPLPTFDRDEITKITQL
ncbi:MAG: AIR synthase related protein [Dehalococcoidia bacterium]